MEEQKSRAATKAKNKYNSKAYDRFHISVKKGNKAIIETAAKNENKSLNSYVIEAVDKQLTASGNPSILENKDGDVSV
jgi:predicted HicB family RNase H-like nuclease